jgi:glutamyl-Q tRNA(Asp) synthetase
MNDTPISDNQSIVKQKIWTGRFAPSPSGPLHLGSLVAALASYLIAKQKGGQWLVRIEDIDPPREVAGATAAILQSLQDFGFEWDGPVVYQSERNNLYQQRLEELIDLSIVYECGCSRKMIANRNQGIYDGFCAVNKLQLDPQNLNASLRIDFERAENWFTDQLLGDCHFRSEKDREDFVIKRRDG